MGQFGSVNFPDSGGIAQPAVAPTPAVVVASATVVDILAANTARKGVIITNASNKILYLKFGTGAAVLSHTVQIPSLGTYPLPINYQGILTGIWEASPTGNAMVTEFA